MRLLIISESYPHEKNLSGDVFTHVRAKKYAKNHEVRAFSYPQVPNELIYEGISIQLFDDAGLLLAAVKDYNPDKILIHFYQSWMLEGLIKKVSIPVIIWVHGYEVTGWYRRLFNYTLYSPVLLSVIKNNIKQQYYYHQLITYSNNTNTKVHFVFVSHWIKKVAEQDTLSTIKNFSIIPNPIDVELFRFDKKSDDLRKKILVLRSFKSKKYANDISVKAILQLSKTAYFNELTFSIIGDGPLFDSLLLPLRNFPNVHIQRGVVPHSEIPALHKEYGIFLCPTRQDTHGVSMCEAMSSGLVPITSNNSAIPEYVKHGVTGILTKSPGQVAQAVEDLYNHTAKFQKISIAASQSMSEICNIHTIIHKELSIIQS